MLDSIKTMIYVRYKFTIGICSCISFHLSKTCSMCCLVYLYFNIFSHKITFKQGSVEKLIHSWNVVLYQLAGYHNDVTTIRLLIERLMFLLYCLNKVRLNPNYLFVRTSRNLSNGKKLVCSMYFECAVF